MGASNEDIKNLQIERKARAQKDRIKEYYDKKE